MRNFLLIVVHIIALFDIKNNLNTKNGHLLLEVYITA